MQFHAHIGVYPEERAVGQDIIVNVELDAKPVDNEVLLEDKLENTINYGPVYKMVAEIVSRPEIKLIETLAVTILQSIKADYSDQLDNVIVSIKKKNLPINGIIDSAEVEVSDK
ncbi:hypothetical protein ABM34_08305 [Companilactobacillus ginsenosidimutans]|uniref:7,8-dihydroneopterin aldolase n=2 Tax=Companilactobacillus ginsenosidimutans TaxID=1007676 RepID=A0A0H4QNT6_9LACO|nr:hypothetical protein ABM34_08305 [Companilactobacillus ginsenosidimutans]